MPWLWVWHISACSSFLDIGVFTYHSTSCFESGLLLGHFVVNAKKFCISIPVDMYRVSSQLVTVPAAAKLS